MQVFAPAGALFALEDTGAAVALASGKETSADVAAACGAPAAPAHACSSSSPRSACLAATATATGSRPARDALLAPGRGRPWREPRVLGPAVALDATGEPLLHQITPTGPYAAPPTGAALTAEPRGARGGAVAGRSHDGGDVLDIGAGLRRLGHSRRVGRAEGRLSVARPAPGPRRHAGERPGCRGWTGAFGRFRATGAAPLPRRVRPRGARERLHLEAPADVGGYWPVRGSPPPGGTIAVVDAMPG